MTETLVTTKERPILFSGKMVRFATNEDVPVVKKIADANKNTLGFVTRPALFESIKRNQLYVLTNDTTDEILGFANLWHRRDGLHTIQEICIEKKYRGQGLGTLLVAGLPKPIRLKCLVDNKPANTFYSKLGFTIIETISATTTKRALNVWTLI